MKFEDILKRGIIRKIAPNEGMINSAIFNAMRDITYLRSSKIDENSSRKITTGYYDILRSLLEAFVLSEGYKVSTHEALTHYLKFKGDNYLALKFDRLRILRNKINYYARDVSSERTAEIKEEVERLLELVKKKYLSKYFHRMNSQK